MKTLWKRFKKPILLFVLFFLLLEIVFFIKPAFFSGPAEPFEPFVSFPVRVVVALKEGIATGVKRYFYLVGVEKDNELLRQKIRKLRLENSVLTSKVRDMEEMVKFPFYFPPTTWEGTLYPLVGRDPSALFDSVLIYTGGKKLKQGTPVIHWNGVVGMVISSELLSAKVMLLTNINSSIDVYDIRSGVRGIFQGTSSDLGRIAFVPDDRDVRVGDYWVTSGLDGIYPRGVDVAVTRSVKEMKEEPFYIITAKPTLDIFSFNYVLVPGIKK